MPLLLVYLSRPTHTSLLCTECTQVDLFFPASAYWPVWPGQSECTQVDQTFEEIVADLANTRFNKTVFEGTATAQAFEWDIAMETYWPAHYGRFRESWTAGAQDQGTWRLRRKITWPEWHEMYRTLPHSQPIGLVQSAYVTCLLRGNSTKLVQQQHRVLYERQNAAASLGMYVRIPCRTERYLCTATSTQSLTNLSFVVMEIWSNLSMIEIFLSELWEKS